MTHGRIIQPSDMIAPTLAQVFQQLQGEASVMANYRTTVEIAGRIYAERLRWHLATFGAAGPVAADVAGGEPLPPDVARGLGLTAGKWDPDAEAMRAIGEAWNLSATFQDMLPALQRASADAMRERQEGGGNG